MKALSLTQPWASLVAIGAKTYETRSWSTSYRGPLAIAAAKGFPRACQELVVLHEPFTSTLLAAGLDIAGLKALRGHFLAVVDLVDCIRIDEHSLLRLRTRPLTPGFQRPTEHEESFGDYTPGRFAWALTNVRRLPRPIPASGALGVWTMLDSDTFQVAEQLEAAA